MSKTLEFKAFCFEAYRAEKNLQAKKQWHFLNSMVFWIILAHVMMCFILQEEPIS